MKDIDPNRPDDSELTPDDGAAVTMLAAVFEKCGAGLRGAKTVGDVRRLIDQVDIDLAVLKDDG